MTIATDGQEIITPEQVGTAVFPPARLGRRGVDEQHVREFLYVVRDELLRLHAERASLIDEIQPIDVDTIVSISGADDYAEVTTLGGKHLVRMTLAEFEKSLDPSRFIRVHRSRIVNVERIARAEPAGGGRLLLHMQDGEAIAASRTGSRLLRDRVI